MNIQQRIPKMTYFSGGAVLLFVVFSVFAPVLTPIGPDTPSAINFQPNTPPGSKNFEDQTHLMGTDHVGRDLYARLVYGVRNSLFFALIVVIGCLVLGIVLGGVMGFFGGWIDLVLSRFMEIIGNFPIFLLQLTMLAFLPQSYFILFFVMIFAGWIPYCRFTRAEFFRLRNLDFVHAATALGASKSRRFFRHLLPNSLTPIITYVPFDLTQTIIALGALSFLGFGEPIDQASIGELLRQAQDSFKQGAWWMVVFPGGALFVLTLSLALFGSAIRDILDPRHIES